MRRLVALGVAVALVVIAVVIRNGIDNGNNGGGGGKLRLVCAPELEQPCRALGSDVDVSIEEPGITADRLEKASGDLGLDAWLAPGPWAEIVKETQERDGQDLLLAVGAALGRSRVGLAVWPDRLGVLKQACPGLAIAWRCLGDVAAKGPWTAVGGRAEWGLVKLGLPDPTNDATGLAALGAATAGQAFRTDLSSIDLQDPGFGSWLRGLAAAEADRPALADVLIRGPAGAGAAATFAAVGTPLVQAYAGPQKPVLAYPAPVANADVVLGSAISDQGRRLARLLDERGPEVLSKAGWEHASPQPSGLPSAGFLDALRSAWKDAAG